jgi:Domain of unknown function (DUF4232)
MDDEIRKLLHRKAGEVVGPRAVPESLPRRVRFRLARNIAAVGAMLLLVGAGTFVGAHALTGPVSSRSIGPASTPKATPTPSDSANSGSTTPTPSDLVTACTSGQLRAVGTFEGAAGSREGAISLSNFSDVTCTLEGQPKIALSDQNLMPITSDVMFSSAPAGWEVNASPPPPGWPVVTLAPGQAASVRIRWSNWCPNGRSTPLWQIEIPGSGPVDVNGFDAASPPPCNGQTQPSTIEVGPFEPGPAQ